LSLGAKSMLTLILNFFALKSVFKIFVCNKSKLLLHDLYFFSRDSC
jgi:hypothetical protein